MPKEDNFQTDLPSGMGQPAQRALRQAGIFTLNHLARYSEAEIKALHGIGPKALDLLRQTLLAKGLSFAEKQDPKS